MISNNFVADRDRYNKIYIGNDIQWTTTNHPQERYEKLGDFR